MLTPHLEHMDLDHLEVIWVEDLLEDHQWAEVAVVVDMVNLKQHMECHLRITITILNRTCNMVNRWINNNSLVKTKDKMCLNIVIKATWNIKLQRGTKTNTAKKTPLRTSLTANQLPLLNILTRTLHR
jgi:hypothetical protein